MPEVVKSILAVIVNKMSKSAGCVGFVLTCWFGFGVFVMIILYTFVNKGLKVCQYEHLA